MEIGQKLRDVWGTVRAGRAGINEGLNSVVAAVPDSALSLIGIGARAMGAQIDKEKGKLSGNWVKARLDEMSHQHAGYDLRTETPDMKSVREGAAVATEGAGIIASIGVSLWPRAAAALPQLSVNAAKATTAVTLAEAVATGVEQGIDRTSDKEKTPALALAPN